MDVRCSARSSWNLKSRLTYCLVDGDGDEESVTISFSNYTIYHQLLKKLRTTQFIFILGVVCLLELWIVQGPMSVLLMTACIRHREEPKYSQRNLSMVPCSSPQIPHGLS